MFCHNCGTKIPDDAEYCYHCGTKVAKINTIKKWSCPVCDYVHEGDVPPEKCPQCGIPGSTFTEQDIKSQPLRPDSPTARKLLCPNCHSSNLVPVTETKTDISGGGYGVGKGCCGWILFGPFGLLCGLCGSGVKSNTETITSWVCKDCGHKFQSPLNSKSGMSLVETLTILIISILLLIIGLVWCFISFNYNETYLWVLPFSIGVILAPLYGLLFLLQWFRGSKEEKDEFIKKYHLKIEKIKSNFGDKK